jgi:hypothetical protein
MKIMSNDELPSDVSVLLTEARDRDRAEIDTTMLSRRVLADFDAVTAKRNASLGARIGAMLSRLTETAWPGAPLWKPAVALGLSLAIGLGVGALLPLDNSSDDTTTVALDTPQAIDLEAELQ